jgi:hypothetical protein
MDYWRLDEESGELDEWRAVDSGWLSGVTFLEWIWNPPRKTEIATIAK